MLLQYYIINLIWVLYTVLGGYLETETVNLYEYTG